MSNPIELNSEIIKNINKSHEEAMDLAFDAGRAKRYNGRAAVALFKKAYELEKICMEHCPKDQEPSWTIITSSCMYLAKDAEMYDETKRLANILLASPYEEYRNGANEILNELK